MYYLLCKHRVADYAKWRGVFDSHAEAQRDAGLHLLHVLRDASDPNLLVLLFRADDLARARAFVEAPAASQAGEAAGVIGVPEISFLTDDTPDS